MAPGSADSKDSGIVTDVDNARCRPAEPCAPDTRDEPDEGIDESDLILYLTMGC